MLQIDIEIYIKGYNICLTSKTVCYKSYKDLQSLLISTYWWENISMDFIISFPISIYWKDDSYNSILVIINQLTKLVYYELVKVTINLSGLAKLIINIIVYY